MDYKKKYKKYKNKYKFIKNGGYDINTSCWEITEKGLKLYIKLAETESAKEWNLIDHLLYEIRDKSRVIVRLYGSNKTSFKKEDLRERFINHILKAALKETNNPQLNKVKNDILGYNVLGKKYTDVHENERSTFLTSVFDDLWEKLIERNIIKKSEIKC